MQPDHWQNVNPHHILWNPIQIGLATIARASGFPTTIPFQLFGILISSATLAVFYVVLRRSGADRLYTIAAVLFLAFSPAFWYLSLQNHPYPLACLALLIYFYLWCSDNRNPPLGLRLWIAACALGIGALLHQAIILLVVPGVLVLSLFGSDTPARRLARGLVWGACVSVAVLAVYVLAWVLWIKNQVSADPFYRWTTFYALTLHPPQLLDLGLAKSFARSAIGFSQALMQSDQIHSAMSDLSATTDLWIYGLVGVAALATTILLLERAGSFRRLLRTDPRFALCFYSVFACWAFAFAWEATTAQYWLFGLFPILLCIGMLLRTRRSSLVFAAVVLIISGWNLRFNRDTDRARSQEFPEPMLRSIDQHVGNDDIFIILGDGGYGDINYDLLVAILNAQQRNPPVLILNDFVIPAGLSSVWTKSLSEKIESTLSSGGKVFVAQHLFDADSYQDLSHSNDAFNEQVDQRYVQIDGPTVYSQVQAFFKGYDLIDSDFAVGTDKYFLLKRKQPEVQNSPTDSGDSRDLDRENSFSRSPGPPHGHRSYPPRRSSSALERASGPLGQKKMRNTRINFGLSAENANPRTRMTQSVANPSPRQIPC